METLEGWVKNKTPISPQLYLDSAIKLTVLLGNESDKLAEMRLKCARMKREWLNEGKSNIDAKSFLEASDEFLEAEKQESLVRQVTNYILIAKKYATVVNDQLRSGL